MAVSFSIIIPVYNKERYVRQCIDSILDQTHNDLKIIIVNDGSTDSSREILDSYTDFRIKAIHCTNGGVSTARNIGLENSTKDYITFIDADDWVNKDFLSIANEEIEKYGCELLIAGLTKVSDKHQRAVKSTFNIGKIGATEFKDGFVDQMFSNEGILGYVAAKFIQRSFLENNNLRFDPNMRLAEDLAFWISAYKQNPITAISDSSSYYYRQGAENSSYSLSPQHMSQFDLWTEILETFTSPHTDGHQTVLHKLRGIYEAHFLELNDIRYSNVQKEKKMMNYRLLGNKEISGESDTFFQKILFGGNTLIIWSYLKSRRLYHLFSHR